MSEKTFHRSQNNKILGGVCGGIADYTDLPDWVVRIAWVLVTICLAFFIGIILYILMWWLVPQGPDSKKLEPNTIDADYEVKE